MIGSPLKPRTSIISEKNMEQIQKIVEEKGLAKKKKIVKIVKKKDSSKSDSKVIKADQFQDKTGFLSGMGFVSDEVVVVEEEEEEKPDMSVTKKDFEVIKEQVVETRKEREHSRPSSSRHRGGGRSPH